MNTDLRKRVEELERRVAELEKQPDLGPIDIEVAQNAIDAANEFNDSLDSALD